MSSPEPNEADPKQRHTGLEKPVAGAEEAGGRSRHRMFTCKNCGAGNYYEPSWNAINCWRCGHSQLARYVRPLFEIATFVGQALRLPRCHTATDAAALQFSEPNIIPIRVHSRHSRATFLLRPSP